jgi:hypothetical protein
MIFVALGEIVDVLRRPVGHFHAKMETHLGENFLDLVERLAAEIRGPQHFRFGLLNEIANIHDIVVLQAVCRPDRQFQLVDLLEKRRVESQFRDSVLGDFRCGSSKLTKMES